MTVPRPIQTARRRNRIAGLVIVVFISAAAWWAIQPLPTPAIPQISLATPSVDEQTTQVSELGTSSFEAAIWYAPSLATSERNLERQRIETRPSEITLKLVAITTQQVPGGVARQAALYDTDSSTLQILEEGEIAAGWQIESILAQEVVLRADSRVATLRLRREQPPLKLGSAQP